MRWLELIQVRATEGNARAMANAAKDRFSENDPPPGLVEARFYTHAWSRSDIAIHLLWEGQGPPPGKSKIGHRMAESLGFHGVVSHSMWFEER